MTGALAKQKCLHHALREAVARCPECKQFYCRECITEHDDRIICTACLRKFAAAAPAKPGWGKPFVSFLKAMAGLIAAWMLFLSIGKILLAIPAQFHEGTVWRPFTSSNR
jgi:hypothetical protein